MMIVDSGAIDSGTVDSDSTIAVVGASARAAAFSLLRAGQSVVAADLFADADLARCCPTTRITPYPAGFADWLSQTDCDRWLYTGALENYPELVDQLAELRPLQGHSGEVLRRVRDPLLLQTVLTHAGFDFPETRLAADAGSRDDVWIGKTYRGSSGSGVGITEGATYLQRRVEGTPLSAVFMGEKLLGVTRQLVGESWAGASGFQYCGSIGPWLLPKENQQQLHALGKLLCSSFALTHLYGVDFIFDGERLWVLEINPRYTAAVEIVERIQGMSVFALTANASQEKKCFGKTILFAKALLTLTAAISDQLLEQAGQIPWPQLADIPAAGTEISIGQPVLTLFAEADSCETVALRLRQRVDRMQQFLYGETTGGTEGIAHNWPNTGGYPANRSI